MGRFQLDFENLTFILYFTIACLINSTECQLGCPAGSFGPDCNYLCTSCFDVSHCVSTKGSNGGCSDGVCIKGRGQPPLCQAHCGLGIFANKFGFNCNSQCHCNGSDGCDTISGNCDRGCDPAWAGPGCQTQLPAMKRPPTIFRNDCAGLVVMFAQFDPSIDAGSSSVDFYRLQTDNGTGGLAWFDLRDFSSANPGPYNVTLLNGSLSTSMRYRFRVMAHFQDPHFENFGPATNASEAVRPNCTTTVQDSETPAAPTPGLQAGQLAAILVSGCALLAVAALAVVIHVTLRRRQKNRRSQTAVRSLGEVPARSRDDASYAVVDEHPPQTPPRRQQQPSNPASQQVYQNLAFPPDRPVRMGPPPSYTSSQTAPPPYSP